MKHYEVAFSQNAVDGLLAISDYIALDNPVRAGSFVKALTTSLRKTLSVFPYSGKVAGDLNLGREIRIWSYGHYNSYYRVLEDRQVVEVLFIFHASRDADALIRDL